MEFVTQINLEHDIIAVCHVVFFPVVHVASLKILSDSETILSVSQSLVFWHMKLYWKYYKNITDSENTEFNIAVSNSELFLKPGPGPWTQNLRKSWTLRSLDQEKLGF